MSSQDSQKNLNPIFTLNELNERNSSSEEDESVHAPTSKLPNIPFNLSDFISPKPEEVEKSEVPSFEVKLDPNSSTARFEKDSLLKEQLESVDFYIEQGFLDVALSTLERLEQVFPNHPLISEKLERMANLEKDDAPIIPSVAPVSQTTPVKQISNSSNLDENVFHLPNTSELPDLKDLTSEEEMDFKSLVTDNALSKDKDSQQTPQSQPVNQSFSSMFTEPPAEFYQTISDDQEVENLLSKVDTAAAEIAAVQNGLTSLIDDVEGESEVSEDLESDFSSHFNIGQAYFDIELYDDAIEEFQTAYRIIQDLGTQQLIFQCCILLGKSFKLKQMPRPALIWLKKALDTKAYQLSEHLELLYELAGVHEELGEIRKAFDIYQEISKSSPNYQDVNERIKNLQSIS
jgi:tetratricopeptide (TPR) repeat protein